MFKIKIAIVLAMMMALSLTAQQSSPVALVSSHGKVKYKKSNSKRFRKIQPGAVIQPGNTLKVYGSRPATVYSNGSFKQLNAGTHKLSSVFDASNNMRRMGFDNTFENYLVASISLTLEASDINSDWARITDPKKTGDGWGVKDKKKAGDGWGVKDKRKAGDGWGVKDKKKAADGWGVKDKKKAGDGWGVKDKKKAGDGWGGQGSSIHGILPFGKLLPGPVNFFWSRPAGVSSYRLEIRDADEKLVHQATVRDTFIKLDLTQKPFTSGAHYIWNVTAVEKEDMKSNPLEFVVSTAAEQKDIYNPLKRSEIYESGDPALRGIMEAVALERGEWFVQAANAYARLKKQYPKNNTVRIMYATFWARYDLIAMVHAAVECK